MADDMNQAIQKSMINLNDLSQRLGSRPAIEFDRAAGPAAENLPPGSLVGALFRRDTTIGAIINSPDRGSFTAGETDPDAFLSFVPERHMNRFDAYALTTNQQEADTVTRALDQEMEDSIRVSQSPVKSFFYGVGVQALDPVNYLPGSVVFNNYKKMGVAARAALEAGTAGLVSTAAQETIIQSNQLSRELSESVTNTLAAGILSAAIGGATGFYTARRGASIAADTGTSTTGTSTTGTSTTPSPQSITAATTEINHVLNDYTPKGKVDENGNVNPNDPAFPEFVRKGLVQSPRNRMLKSEFDTPKTVADELYSADFITNKNRLGEATKNVESQISLDIHSKDKHLIDLESIFFDQAGIKPGFFAARKLQKQAGSNPNIILNMNTWSREVALAVLTDKPHANESVNKAVKAFKESILDHYAKRAMKLGLLEDGVTPKNAKQYYPQWWHFDKIVDNQAGFLQDTINGFTEINQANKRIRKSKEYEAAAKAVKETKEVIKLAEAEKIKIKREIQTLKKAVAELDKSSISLAEAITKKLKKKDTKKSKKALKVLSDANDKLKKAIEKQTKNEEQAKALAKILGEKQDLLMNTIKEVGGRYLNEYEVNGLFHTQGKRKGQLRKVSTTAEIQTAAKQSLDRILGRDTSKINNRIVRELDGAAKPLKDRTFLLSQERMVNWMNLDIFDVGGKYVRAMAPATRMTKMAKDKGFATIKEWHDARINQLKLEFDIANKGASGDAAVKLDKKFKEQRQLITDSFKLNLGIYGDGPNIHNGSMARHHKALLNWNYIRLLGSMTLSSIPDMGMHVFTHGPFASIYHGLVPVLKQSFGHLKNFSKDDLNAIGVANSTVMGTMLQALASLDPGRPIGTFFGRTFDRAVQTFGNVTLMNQWNDAQQLIAGTLSINRSLKSIESLVLKKGLNRADKERLFRLGISADDALHIHDMWTRVGKPQDNGTYFADWVNWKPTNKMQAKALDSFKTATLQEINQTVIVPSLGDKPLVSQTSWGKLLFQFKNYSFATTNKILLSGIQRSYDANVYYGLATMMSLGALSYIITQVARGNDDIDYSFENLAQEAIDRSGALGLISEVYNLANKAGLGFGAPTSRFQSRGIWGAVLGPSAGLVEDIKDTVNRVRMASDESPLTTKDLEKMMRLFPYQNLFYIYQLNRKAVANLGPKIGFETPDDKSKDIFK